MGKFKMPTFSEFLATKVIYEPKKEPPWVFLENEMRANIDVKPYNKRVGDWLVFLKDLKLHYHREAIRRKRRLEREAGPKWFFQLSNPQRLILKNLKTYIQQDIIEDKPVRIKKALLDLGVNLRLNDEVLKSALQNSYEDAGLFVWELYTLIYKKKPIDRCMKYDMNAKLLMSSLVFIDLEECISLLKKITEYKEPIPEPPKKKPAKKKQPYTRYGEYLEKAPTAAFYTTKHAKKPEGPKPLGYKFKLKTKESYEALRLKPEFLEMRKERAATKAKPPDRTCNYKFWEPPSTLRNTDPKMAAYVNKLKMIHTKGKAKHKAPYENVQYHVGNVAFSHDQPYFILQNVALLPTGYIPLNGGIVHVNGEYITHILGYWKYPTPVEEKCDLKCECLTKWGEKVMDFMKDSKCRCGHRYDYYHEGKPKEKYFHKPTKNTPMWIDHAKINQLDPMENFIKNTVEEALLSQAPTPEESMATISAARIKPKVLLGALLADLATTTPLILPHLPDANGLQNLQEWVRKRVRGKVTEKQQQRYKTISQRRWLDLHHVDFKALTYRIPFTLSQMEHMNWDHKDLIVKLFDKLLQNFVRRNKQKQLEQTRLMWSTMKAYVNPSSKFLDAYFSYMPARMQDTFVINPLAVKKISTFGAKTCPLNF